MSMDKRIRGLLTDSQYGTPSLSPEEERKYSRINYGDILNKVNNNSSLAARPIGITEQGKVVVAEGGKRKGEIPLTSLGYRKIKTAEGEIYTKR